ncbi:MAG TPA: S41 family peptidase [Lunatimonas sp.]|nr:S41 family peptidase [Lunatimonas sp.]
MKNSKISNSRYFKAVLLMGMIGMLLSCNDLMLGEEPGNTPTRNFQVMWNEFDRMYALFEVKNIDWDEVYAEYEPRVNDNISSNELFDLLSEMLGVLNDGHVWMVKPEPGFRRYDSGPVYPEGDFNLALVRSKLVEEMLIGNASAPDIIYGKLEGNLGYIYLENLGQMPGFYQEAMDVIMPYMKGTLGLVIDARGIEGGDDRSSQALAGYFAKKSLTYMVTKFRNGPGRQDFTSPIIWNTTPSSRDHYDKDVAVLTNRHTGSAGETFVLAMKTMDHVKVIGDYTFGAFSDNPKRELPNGWIYSISTGDFRDASGVSFEGTGIPPQQVVLNTREEIEAGLDRVLEAAILELKGI